MSSETELERMVVRLIGDGSSYTTMMKDAMTNTTKTTSLIESLGKRIEAVRKMIDQAGKSIQGVGNDIRRAGQAMSLAVTVPLTGIGAVAVNEFAKFDQAMTETFAKMGRQAPEVRKQLEDTAKGLSMGGEVAFTPTELAKGYEELASAGLDANRSMSALPQTAKFAQAGAFGMDVAVKQLMGSMAGFGKLSKDPVEFSHNLERFSDVIVGVANETTTGVKEVAEAMAADGAMAAKGYGMELETLGAILGVYAMQNKDASEAGNLTGRAIRLMTSSFQKEEKTWKKMGIDLVNKATGEWIHFADAIEQIEKAFKGMTGPARTAALEAMGFEALAQKSIVPLIGQSAELRRQEEIYRKHGTTVEMAAIQMESFTNQIKVMRNHVLVAAIEIGQTLAPYIAKLNTFVKEGMNAWRGLSPNIKEAVIVITAVAAAIGPVLVGIGLLIATVGMAVSGFSTMLAPISMFVAVLGSIPVSLPLIIAGLMAVAASVLYLDSLDFSQMWEDSKQAAVSFFTDVKGFLNNFQDNMNILGAWITRKWNTTWNGTVGVLQEAIDGMAGLMNEFFPQLTDLWGGVTEGAATAWGTAVSYVQQFVSGSLGFMANFSQNIKIVWSFFIDNWKTILGDMVRMLEVFVGNMVSNFGVGIKTTFRLWLVFEGWLAGMFKRLFSFEVVDAVLTGLIVVGQKVRDWANAAWETIKQIFKGKNGAGVMDTFIDSAINDLGAGMGNVNLVEEMAKVIKEESANITANPLEGFVSLLKEFPEFNLEVEGIKLSDFIFSQAEEAAKAGNEGGKIIGSGIAGGIDANTKNISKDLKNHLKMADAAEFGSAEAMNRINEYMTHAGGDTTRKVRAIAATAATKPPETMLADTQGIGGTAYMLGGSGEGMAAPASYGIGQSQYQLGTEGASSMGPQDMQVEQQASNDKQTDLLGNIHSSLERLVEISQSNLDKPPIEVEEAEIA